MRVNTKREREKEKTFLESFLRRVTKNRKQTRSLCEMNFSLFLYLENEIERRESEKIEREELKRE